MPAAAAESKGFSIPPRHAFIQSTTNGTHRTRSVRRTPHTPPVLIANTGGRNSLVSACTCLTCEITASRCILHASTTFSDRKGRGREDEKKRWPRYAEKLLRRIQPTELKFGETESKPVPFCMSTNALRASGN